MNAEAAFVPRLPVNVEPLNVAVVEVVVYADDETEKLNSEVCCDGDVLILVEVVVKKPALAYAVELFNVDDDGATALLVAIDDNRATALDVLADATVDTVHTSQPKCCSDFCIVLVSSQRVSASMMVKCTFMS